MICFAKGAHYALKELSELGFDVLSLDNTINPETARQTVKEGTSLQGNLDPLALFSPPQVIESLVEEMLSQFGPQRYIANLGHGCLPSHDPEHIGAFISAVHKASIALINK